MCFSPLLKNPTLRGYRKSSFYFGKIFMNRVFKNKFIHNPIPLNFSPKKIVVKNVGSLQIPISPEGLSLLRRHRSRRISSRNLVPHRLSQPPRTLVVLLIWQRPSWLLIISLPERSNLFLLIELFLLRVILQNETFKTLTYFPFFRRSQDI